MTIIDRYVLQLFIKIMVVCFASLAGLFVVVETFNNLEEFLQLGATQGGLLNVLQSYFGPRIISLFDRTSPLLTLMAAIFTLTWLHRTSELTAIMAAGIPRSRVAKPLIIAAVVTSGLAMISREIVIPKFGQSLVRNAQSWDGTAAMLHARYDYQSGIFLNGSKLIPKEQRIVGPAFRLPPRLARHGAVLEAESAFFQAKTSEHPSGYRLVAVKGPKELVGRPSLIDGDKLRVALPADTPWLKADEAFVPSEVQMHQLEVGDALKQYASTMDLVTELRNPGLDYGASLKRLTHHRILQPFLDLTLFLVGLPLVVSRGDRGLITSAATALGVLILFYVLELVCSAAADSGMLQAYQAAWAPLALFIPWAVWAYPRLDR